MRRYTVLTLSTVLLMMLAFTSSFAQFPTTPVYINEIHYDNLSADIDESIEIAGPAGTDMSDYLLYLYNGQGGLTYAPGNPFYLNGIIPDQQNGYGTICYSVPGIQNGSPDGMALVYFPSGALYPVVEQFISYEGFFPANNGPAVGDTSDDIGVKENSTSPIGNSLQLGGFGFNYEDFLLTGGWQSPSPASCGQPNNNQTFQELDYCTNFLDFWMTEQTGPATIDTGAQTVEIEVVTGTDLTNLIPYFDLCFFATVTDSITGDPVTSGGGPMDFSNPVTWFIDNKKPGKYWTITVTEQVPDMVINETDLTQPGADLAEFIELKNNGSDPVNITGMELALIDGATGTAYANYIIPSNTLPGHDYFVICANAANTGNCDLDVSPDISMIQDGSPDAIALYTATGSLVDVVSYGGSAPGYYEGTGSSLTDPPAEYKVGLSRFPDGTDTDNNDSDIDLLCITPGYANAFDTIPCICTITDVYLDSTSACDSLTSTFGAYITVEYAKAPASGTLVVNGQSFPISGSPQTVMVTGIPATGNPVAVNIYFSDHPACGFSTAALFLSPPPCEKCNVVDAWTGTQTSCMPSTNFYTQEIYLDVMFNPGGQWVVVIGDARDTTDFIPQSGNVGRLDASGLISDGMPAVGYIYNLLVPGCVYEVNGLWIAPPNCYDSPGIVINEVDYDQPGTDMAEFIELKNNESFPVNLRNYAVELVNGGSGLPYDRIQLPSFVLQPGDYYVMCANPGMTPNCDLDLSAHLNHASNPFAIDDGAPDAIALYDLFGTMVDVVSYEGDVAGYVETSGLGVEDDPAWDGHGISRYQDGTDTDDNSSDFKYRCITPGEANTHLQGYCGPFHTLELFVRYKNEYGTPMPDVVLDVAEAKGAVGTYVSDNSAMITIDSLKNILYDVQVDASVYEWGWGGVNALDALLMARHFVNIQALFGDYLKASNVVSPQTVNSTDALMTAKRFAGLITSFETGDWYPPMVTFDYFADDPTLFRDTLDILCFGDANGSHIPIVPPKNSTVSLGNSDALQVSAHTGEIPFSFKHAVNLGALSLSMQLPENVRVDRVTMADGSEALFTQNGQQLKLSWFNVDGLEVSGDKPFMSFELSGEMRYNPSAYRLLPGTEIANIKGEVLNGIRMLLPGVEKTLSIWPNPARDRVEISLMFEEEGKLSIELMDMLGAKVSAYTEELVPAGPVTRTINTSGLASGTYMVRIQHNGNAETRKLIITE